MDNHKNIISDTSIIKNTKIGKNVVIADYSVIGTAPNVAEFFDIKKIYKKKYKHVVIANNVIIKEYCTIHAGTKRHTTIGNNSFVMSNAHIDHDVQVGKFCTIAPSVSLAGNVIIKDYAQVGMGALVHQNITVGEYSMVGMGCVVVKNVPPFSLVKGNPGRINKLNEVRLKRLKISNKLYELIYNTIVLGKALVNINVNNKEKHYLEILKKWKKK